MNAATEAALPRHATWTDPLWLQQHRGVRAENALEYFTRSIFWNQGAEYQLDRVLPHPTGNNAIIIKRRKPSEQISQTQAIYYILDGVIYQCPTIYELMTSRLDKCAYHLEKEFEELSEICQSQREKNFLEHEY